MSTSPTPPRVSHLLTVNVLCEQLAPSYAKAQNNLPEDVYDDVKSALTEGRLQQPLCDAVWRALRKARPSLDENTLLEKLFKALTKGGPRPMAATGSAQEKMSPLFAFMDANVGRVSDAARQALESEAGRAMVQKGLDAAGEFLAGRMLAAAK
ncbi:MAG: hypothetical protein AB2A00_11760 [Myxococcota bacterium]